MIIKEEFKSILKGYTGQDYPLDEIWAGEQTLLPHWQQLLAQIHKIGIKEIGQRSLEIQRILSEEGVTYNDLRNLEKNQRIWKLDPIPFVISNELWNELEEGLQQRAQVLDLVFKDLYGPRKLLHQGILPMELIYSDRRFLRPCNQISFPHQPAILQYAVDISRSPDGQIWVIGDRTQAPSGLAYTLENRITMARILPELFQNVKVRKIAPFYQRIKSNLFEAAPAYSNSPTVVLMSPGPYSATYFEHTFLSSLQGFHLAQGQDLMVKDNYVWLKTLSGLEKVDLIIRHVDDSYCDPLSLRPDSQLGVVGLLQVARKGNIAIANPIGSGILENPGLMAFMPSLCKYFLGEELKIPNIASWWCGREKERKYVIEKLDQLVLKDVSKSPANQSVFAWQLDKKQKEELIQKIKAFPYRYVGQEQAIFSTAPSLGNDLLEPRNTVLRCFASANKEGYFFLPGGLTRSAPGVGNSHVSNSSGGLGKDTWVLSEKKTEPIQYKPKTLSTPLSYKGLHDLPSRTADNLFWVGRYLTRIRISARLMRLILRYQMEIDNFEESLDEEVLSIFLKALTHITMTYPGFVGEGQEDLLKQPNEELERLLKDAQYTGSLAHSIQMLKYAANAVRNYWSSDSWRMIDTMTKQWENWCEEEKKGKRADRRALDELINHLAAIQGFTFGSLSVEEGRPVFELGLEIERAMLTTSLFRSVLTFNYEDNLEDGVLETLLLTCESLSSYRHRYRGFLRKDSFIELMIMEDSYPQSLSYAVKNIQSYLEVLPNVLQAYKLRTDQKKIIQVYSRLQLAEPQKLLELGENDNFHPALDSLLTDIFGGLADAANEIVNTFFSHTYFEPQQSFFMFEPDL